MVTRPPPNRTYDNHTATRRYVDGESGKRIHQFNHGCQYIRPPKTEEFRYEFRKWEESGWL